ncbi:methylenetetrahydrofolate reductase [NAD(P)H] [SAR202 cluster bacterium AC-409-J13_OGT_754m]|nr:methylenetetrahydrofolate reductase [NAD(P)H] [SAR202 cluster bacterium AC-409-J13_OGT_754m]
MGPRPTLSFEFYPPKLQEGIPSVFKSIDKLKEFSPDFVSVTYGAGGSTQSLSEQISIRIKEQTDLVVMAHLTCVSQTKTDVHNVLTRLADAGIQNIIALRGDPPLGQNEFIANKDGFSHANELIDHIRTNFEFGIAAACYPEGHSESTNLELDLEYTKRKVDAGAQFLVTQLFFDNAYFINFLNRARQIGINVPILAGVLPILRTEQIRRFTAFCGATIPDSLGQQLNNLSHDAAAVRELGIEQSTNQVMDLMEKGIDGIHFYALNRSYSISRILSNIGWVKSANISR